MISIFRAPRSATLFSMGPARVRRIPRTRSLSSMALRRDDWLGLG
jgi:hypothetical protein